MPPQQPASNETNDPPASARNVATAYPASNSIAPRLIAIVTLLGLLASYIVHRIDHPISERIKNTVTNTAQVSSSSPTDVSNQPPDVVQLIPGSLAVCYSGYIGMHAAVVKQNLGAIYRVDEDPDIFYFVDLKDDYVHEQTGEKYERTHDIGALHSIFEESKAMAKTFSSGDISPTQSRCHKRDGKDWEHYSHNFIRFYAANGCYDMIKAQEQQSGKQYDWILTLRPDMHISLRIPPSDKQRRVHLSGAAMALVPRETADIYFSAVNAFNGETCGDFDDMGDEPCRNYSYESETTECLLIKWLKKNSQVPSNGVYLNRRIIYPAQKAD